MAYTTQDTPELIRLIDSHLATITSTVAASDTGLRALVLTGGFARGEGTVRGGRPQNDYDLVAVRGFGRIAVPYAEMRARLGGQLGLHIDLAPVAALRLRWVPSTLFWYETALRGRILFGDPFVLDAIPVREAGRLRRDEPLRLLVNRAAGLLLATRRMEDDDAVRLQASKALLAASDARLLAAGAFAPSQTERWRLWEERNLAGSLADARWFAWAFHYKMNPDAAVAPDSHEAWQAAARAIVAAIPPALRHARLPTLEAHARGDGVAERLLYLHRSRQVSEARRWVPHPSARLRIATLRMLKECVREDCLPSAASGRWLAGFARSSPVGHPLDFLEALRTAAPQ